MTTSNADELFHPALEDCTPADNGTPVIALQALRRRDGASRAALARACGTDAARSAAMEEGTLPISPEVATTLTMLSI